MNNRTEQERQETLASLIIYGLLIISVLPLIFFGVWKISEFYHEYEISAPFVFILLISYALIITRFSGSVIVEMIYGENPQTPKESCPFFFKTILSVPRKDIQFLTWLVTGKN